MTEIAEGFGGTLALGHRPVVLSIDLMRSYFDPDSPLCLPSTGCLESASRIIQKARAHQVPVIHTRVEYGGGGIDGGLFVKKVPALELLIGSNPLNDFMPEVAPVDGELVLTKQYASAFFGTSLVSTLQANSFDTIVVLGVSTSGCVRATAVDALQYGFTAVVVRDAVGDRQPGPHEANLYDIQAKYAEVIDEAVAITYLENR